VLPDIVADSGVPPFLAGPSRVVWLRGALTNLRAFLGLRSAKPSPSRSAPAPPPETGLERLKEAEIADRYRCQQARRWVLPPAATYRRAQKKLWFPVAAPAVVANRISLIVNLFPLFYAVCFRAPAGAKALFSLSCLLAAIF